MTKEQTFEHPPRGHVALLAYDSVNDRFQVVHVDANGLLQVDVAAVADPQANAHGYDGAAWRKLPLLWGYTDRWAEDLSAVKSGAGSFVTTTTAVPAGYVYVAQFVYLRNNSGARGATYAAVGEGTAWWYLFYNGTPVRYVPDLWDGAVALREGDQIMIVQGACLDADDIKCGVWGYKMAIAM